MNKQRKQRHSIFEARLQKKGEFQTQLLPWLHFSQSDDKSKIIIM